MGGHSEVLKDFVQQNFVKRYDLAVENARLLAEDININEYLAEAESEFTRTFTKGDYYILICYPE